MNVVNLCPHAIHIFNQASGLIEILPSQGVARVAATSTQEAPVGGFRVCSQTFGEVTGLPDSQPGTIYIVSGMVLAALKGARQDVFGPDTGQTQVRFTAEDEAVGLGKAGQTKYVTGLVR